MGGKTSATSINKYMAKAYDRISVLVPKGQRAEIQEAAKRVGKSANRYIQDAIAAQMERDAAK